MAEDRASSLGVGLPNHPASDVGDAAELFPAVTDTGLVATGLGATVAPGGSTSSGFWSTTA